MRSLVRFLPLAVYIYHIHINLKFEEAIAFWRRLLCIRGESIFVYMMNLFSGPKPKAMSIVRRSSLTFNIFDFFFERYSTKLDMKQDLNVLY